MTATVATVATLKIKASGNVAKVATVAVIHIELLIIYAEHWFDLDCAKEVSSFVLVLDWSQ